ncbi:MAG: Fic family protein [Pseudomonadota bacterium]|nr:Fic family protein [Pseudomonadota bacterium]
MYVGDHKPPHFKDVPDWMDRFISNVQENWSIWTPTELAAYGLWRLNWIHPFVEGNGRTARATCYYILCVRSGALLPGRKVLPERIKESLTGYESGLQAADRAWETDHLDSQKWKTTSPVWCKPSSKMTTCPTKGHPRSEFQTETRPPIRITS